MLKIDLSTTPINQADQAAAYMIVHKVVVEDLTIKGDLYDSNDNRIAKGRVYSYAGDRQNIPFPDLPVGQIAYLDGDNPDETWPIETIKLWLDDHQSKEADGSVSKDDPYYYPADALKADLLLIANPEEIERIEK